MVPMSSFAIKAFDRFMNWLPGIFAIGVIAGGAAACNAMFKGCERIDAEQKAHFDDEGFVVESEVYVSDVGKLRVIHDTKRQVTCYKTYDSMVCVPDREVKR